MSHDWNPDAVGYALASEPKQRMSRAYGPGYEFAIGDPADRDADLSYYPQGRAVHYVTPEAAISLYRVDEPQILENGVVFDSRGEGFHNTLIVSHNGEAIFSNRLGNGPFEPIEKTQATPEAPVETPQIEQPVSSNTKEETEKQPRINVVGRAGRDPRVNKTKSGVLIAKFPLAEHVKDDEGNENTNWHNVVAFRERAQAVSETVKKGETYRVVGYVHEKEKPDGKIEREIVAVSVKPPTKKISDNDQAS
jgi:hypothetical protein